MKQQTTDYQNYDDDNLTQIGTDSFQIEVSHCDTIIEGKHVVIDTIIKNDTLIVEKVMYDREIQIIERLLDKPDAGKSIVSVLILVFCIYSIWKKWNCNNQNPQK